LDPDTFRYGLDADGYSGSGGGAFPVIKYSLVVEGRGMVYEGQSMSEANRQFTLFAIQSKAKGAGSNGETVTLFKNYDIIREYNPPDRESVL
jgi:hypothetical protein